jgi:hypothetical protein
VRITPVGTPVLMMIPSRTDQVAGAQFTLTQPEKSRPLKSGVQSGSAPRAGDTTAIISHTVENHEAGHTEDSGEEFMALF